MNDKGFTLIELLISTAIMGFLAVVASIGVLQIVKFNVHVTKSVELQETSRSLATALPFYLGQGLDMDWTNSPINNIGNGRGRLLTFSSSLEMSSTAQAIPIGVFLREAGNPGNGTNLGEINATAMYFKNPTPTTSGELIFSSSSASSGAHTLSANNPRARFNNIVEFEITPGGYTSQINTPVRVARVRVVYRKFTAGNANDMRFCPGMITNGACRSETQFKDLERIYFITLPNNSLTTSDYISSTGGPRTESLYGDMYFFRPSSVVNQ
jgi:prepilin-type N-terminal cleavage/methylation domain-containing protein